MDTGNGQKDKSDDVTGQESLTQTPEKAGGDASDENEEEDVTEVLEMI